MFRAALAETKVGPDPLPPQVEPLLLPVQPLPARPDLLSLALHHDGGPALPLHPVYLPCLVHLSFQLLAKAASEVEGEVLVGLLTLLHTLHEPWLRPQGQTSSWSCPSHHPPFSLLLPYQTWKMYVN